MSISERQKQIVEILNERTYISVNELSKLTFTSTSSIRRDLTYLQDNGIVKRLHGGVTLSEVINNVASFYDRARKNVKEKRIIAQKAVSLLKDGQSILLDSSTTATFLLPYIAKFHGITLFTNNLSTALKAIELGINTTQATVSRDIKELSLVKMPARSGDSKYALPVATEDLGFTPKLRMIFRECVRKVDIAQNIVVIKTINGMGNAAAIQQEHPGRGERNDAYR